MPESPQSILRDKRNGLDFRDKSSPPALTDVFVSEARKFLKNDSEDAAKAYDEVVKLSLDAGISRSVLENCLSNMHAVGSITADEQTKLLLRFPSEEKKEQN